MAFKFEISLKENQVLHIENEDVIFTNPTFEKIEEYYQKNYDYKNVVQLGDIVLDSENQGDSFEVAFIYKDGDKQIETIVLSKLNIIY